MSNVNDFFALSQDQQQAAFIAYISNRQKVDQSSLAYKIGMVDFRAGLYAQNWKRAACLNWLTELVTDWPHKLRKVVVSEYVAGQCLACHAKLEAARIKAERKAAKAAAPAPINGAVLYEGPSAIDGKNIALIITQMNTDSTNSKTGAMVQTYILRTDIDPVKAAAQGLDVSICGDCKHRPKLAKETGEASCYVNLGQGALSVYKAFKRGNYPRKSVSEIAHMIAGKNVRFGTYGDPCACPIEIFQDLAKACKGHTGYTHQWRAPGFNFAWADLLMASVDNKFEQLEAASYGFRYFRVQIGQDAPLAGEISCPASKEAGARTTCAACLLCGGTSKKAKNIVIQDHGRGWQGRMKRALALSVVS